MEKKIGTTFEINLKLSVEEEDKKEPCEGCFFYGQDCDNIKTLRGFCASTQRSDKKGVIFRLNKYALC